MIKSRMEKRDTENQKINHILDFLETNYRGGATLFQIKREITLFPVDETFLNNMAGMGLLFRVSQPNRAVRFKSTASASRRKR